VVLRGRFCFVMEGWVCLGDDWILTSMSYVGNFFYVVIYNAYRCYMK